MVLAREGENLEKLVSPNQQGIPRRSAMYSHLPQKALGIHVFPRIPTYSHVFPLVFPRPIYRLEKTFIFQFSKLYIPGIPTGNTVCCRRLCWADGIPMGIRGNTVCCRPSGNALSFLLPSFCFHASKSACKFCRNSRDYQTCFSILIYSRNICHFWRFYPS